MDVTAVQALIDGESNIMLAKKNNAMHFITLDVAIKHEKVVSKQLIDAQQNIKVCRFSRLNFVQKCFNFSRNFHD